MLFLFFAFGALISVCSVVASNADGCSRHALHNCRRRENGKRLFNYSSVNYYRGMDFLNGSLWTYFTGPDITGGQVNYLSRPDAQQNGLAYVQGDNKTVLRVDSWTNLPLGALRNSVRISSVNTFHHGLVVADFDHMPYGCSVWPAFWTVGPNWPFCGEIDIVEGVNNNQQNQYTFHTGGNQVCNIPEQVPVVNNAPALNFTGSVMHTNCSSTPSSNTGCAVLDAGNSSYGQAFAQVGGGVFALLWNSEGIKIWHFERQSIPGDVHSPNPDPDSWPTPNTFLSAENCDVDSFFSPQWLIFDIDLCGGWANGNYYAPNSGCPVGGTCAQQVTTGSNFINATWVINNVTVYNS